MGVRELMTLLKKHAPSALTPVPDLQSRFAGSLMAIDAKNFAYKFLKTRRTPHPESPVNLLPFTPKQNPFHNVLIRSFYMVEHLVQRGIAPVFCFDGEAMELKRFERERREKRRMADVVDAKFERERQELVAGMLAACREGVTKRIEELAELHRELHGRAKEAGVPSPRLAMYEQTADSLNVYLSGGARTAATDSAGDLGADLPPLRRLDKELQKIKESFIDIESLELRSVRLTVGQLEDLKLMFRLMGCAILDAPHEGEALCSHLTHVGLCSVAATEDLDCVIHGDGLLLTKYDGFDNPDQQPIVVDPVEARDAMGLSPMEMIDLALLLQTDFTEGKLHGVGPVKAYNYIHLYGSIESILDHYSPRYDDDLPAFNYVAAREAFSGAEFEGYALPAPEELRWRGPGAGQERELREFLWDKGVLEDTERRWVTGAMMGMAERLKAVTGARIVDG
ncbi:Elongation of fatty acids protein 2 [Irineochytrium annulatum]|nr:Elongation of fatty acids protein 2 [Irineochytrium annulatum]